MKRVLLLDNDRSHIRLFEEFSRGKLDVVSTTSMSDAVNLLEKMKFDIILIDYFTEYSGDVVANVFHDHKRDAKVYFLSGVADGLGMDLQKVAEENRVDGFFKKDDLEQVIEKLAKEA